MFVDFSVIYNLHYKHQRKILRIYFRVQLQRKPSTDIKNTMEQEMQAYQISQGKWSAIDDPLNGKPLEDAGFDRYALKSLKLTYLDSPVTIAPRLPPKSYPLSVSKYKFCCLLKVATLEYRIWIADLPDLIQFLQTLTENTSKHLSTIKDDLETMSKQIDQRFNTIEQRLSQLQTKPSDTPT